MFYDILGAQKYSGRVLPKIPYGTKAVLIGWNWADMKCTRLILMYWIWYYCHRKINSDDDGFLIFPLRSPHRCFCCSYYIDGGAIAVVAASTEKEDDDEASIRLIVVFYLSYYSSLLLSSLCCVHLLFFKLSYRNLILITILLQFHYNSITDSLQIHYRSISIVHNTLPPF